MRVDGEKRKQQHVNCVCLCVCDATKMRSVTRLMIASRQRIQMRMRKQVFINARDPRLLAETRFRANK